MGLQARASPSEDVRGCADGQSCGAAAWFCGADARRGPATPRDPDRRVGWTRHRVLFTEICPLKPSRCRSRINTNYSTHGLLAAPNGTRAILPPWTRFFQARCSTGQHALGATGRSAGLEKSELARALRWAAPRSGRIGATVPPKAGMGQTPCPCWSASVPFISPSSILEATAAHLPISSPVALASTSDTRFPLLLLLLTPPLLLLCETRPIPCPVHVDFAAVY